MFEILHTRHQNFGSYIDVEFSFDLTLNLSHRVEFNYLLNREFKTQDNENFKRDGCTFTYFNHCINCDVVTGCITELIEIQHGKTYPTKDVEGVVYKIIKTLELFSH